MSLPPLPDVDFVVPGDTELVSFSVICRPAGVQSVEEFRERVLAGDVDSLLPDEAVLDRVSEQLRGYGFEVLDVPAHLRAGGIDAATHLPVPVVFARGTVGRFRDVFRVELTRMIRRSDDRDLRHEVSAIVLRGRTSLELPTAISDALVVTIPEPPLLAMSSDDVVAGNDVCLSLPDAVAHVTRAEAVHSRWKPGEPREPVRAAVIDTGFAQHRYFEQRAYRITRVAAPDTNQPDVDPRSHGTFVLANLLACAPECDAFGVKFLNIDIAFGTAMLIAGVRVISVSWVFETGSEPVPDWVLTLEFLILVAVKKLGIVVVVGSGNATNETTPARLPHVVAVGGVAVDNAFSLRAWPQSTSFASRRDPARVVPDLCGVASQINLPMAPAGMECREGATSCATPQVAGVAVLLLQKNRRLTAFEVKALLMLGARDVRFGSSFGGHQAGPGPDLATGFGLVDALTSWNLVP